MNNYKTNIFLISVPHRYDFSDHSCVNKAIQSFNDKIKNITTTYSYVKVIECIHGKKYFTRQGMHHNRRGKTLITEQVVSEITKLTAEKKVVPISLEWPMATDQVDPISIVNPNDVPRRKEEPIVDPSSLMNPVEVLRLNEESAAESQEILDSQTVENQNKEVSGLNLTKTVTNEPIPGTEISDSSSNHTKIKRPRKTPCKRSKDFLW
jgi:hypothetical protein